MKLEFGIEWGMKVVSIFTVPFPGMGDTAPNSESSFRAIISSNKCCKTESPG